MHSSGFNQASRCFFYPLARYLCLLAGIFVFFYVFSVNAQAAPSYKSLDAEFTALQANKQKALLREPWEKIQAKFDDFVNANPKSADAPKAAFMSARCLEEVALRTHSTRDFKKAVLFFGTMAEKYPKSMQAGEALWHKAEIEYTYLKDNAAAKQTLAALLNKTQDSKLKSKAKILQAKIQTEGTTAKPSTVSGNTAQAPGAANSNTPAANTNQAASSNKPQNSSNNTSITEPTLLSVLLSADKNKTTASLQLNTGAGFTYRFIPAAKSGTGKAALIVEVEGVVPKAGIKGLTSVPKGPVSFVNCMQGKLSAGSGKSVPSARVEFTLSGDHYFTIKSDKGSQKIELVVDSTKKQSGAQAGRGHAGKLEFDSSAQAGGTGSSGANANPNS